MMQIILDSVPTWGILGSLQISHIRWGICMVVRSHSRVRSDSSALEAINLLLGMVSEQLSDISTDIESSVESVCDGFQGIGTRARDALTSASTALESSSEGGGLQAFVHRVQICIDVLLRRLTESEQCSKQITQELDIVINGMEMSFKLGTQWKAIGDEVALMAQRINGLGRRPERSFCEQASADLSTLSEKIRTSGQTLVLLNTGLRSAVKNASSRAIDQANDEAQTILSSTQISQNAIEKLKSSYLKVTESLSGSASASRQLNLDITQAVVSMQFQDRVTQRIAHLVEAIAELQHDIQPFVEDTDSSDVKTLTEFLLNRVSEKSTMDSERRHIAQVEQASSIDDSFELF